MLKPKDRLLAGFLSVFGILFLFVVLARAAFHVNPVRSSDRAALEKEMRAHFPSGVSEVYWAPDLEYLEGLAAKYKEAGLDLSSVREPLEKQKKLRAAREQLQKDFERQVAGIAQGEAAVPREERRARLVKLRDLYQLQSLDVGAADEAIKKLDQETKATAEDKPRGHISIVREAEEEEKVETAPVEKPSAKSVSERKTEQKKLKKQMAADIKKVLKAKPPLGLAEQKSRLLSLRKRYERQKADVKPVNDTLAKLEKQIKAEKEKSRGDSSKSSKSSKKKR